MTTRFFPEDKLKRKPRGLSEREESLMVIIDRLTAEGAKQKAEHDNTKRKLDEVRTELSIYKPHYHGCDIEYIVTVSQQFVRSHDSKRELAHALARRLINQVMS